MIKPLPVGEGFEGLPAQAVLCTGHDVDVLHMARQWILIPGGATVLRAEYLAAPRCAVDLIGVAGMQPHRHHGAMGLHAVIEALPGLTQVLTTVERAVPAARRRAETGIHHLWLLRRYLYVA